MNVTPDGARYLAERPPFPFNLRWLVPAVCGQDPKRWVAYTRGSLVLLPVAVACLARTHDLGWWPSIAAGLLVGGLPSVRFLWTHPVLIDGPALLLATLCAVYTSQGWWVPAVLVAVLAGATSERAPVFAALFAWNLLPLIGLAAVVVVALLRHPDPDVLDAENAWVLDHPIKASRKYHAGQWRSPTLMLTPWGLLLAATVRPGAWLAATAAVAYGQLAAATDSVRLYQWAAPVAAVCAVQVIPEPWLVLAVAAHWCNPIAGRGI